MLVVDVDHVGLTNAILRDLGFVSFRRVLIEAQSVAHSGLD